MKNLFSKLAQTFKSQSNTGKIILSIVFLIVASLVVIFGIPLTFIFLPFIVGFFVIKLITQKLRFKRRISKIAVVTAIIILTLFSFDHWLKLFTNTDTETKSPNKETSIANQQEVKEEKVEDKVEEQKSEEIPEEQQEENSEESQDTKEEQTEESITQPNEVYYDVVEVVDGDTIKVNYNGTTESIRFIGIDTPETVHPSKPVQCFGIEASNKAKELMENKKVRLEQDATQGDRDKYNRLLRYVYLEDGTHVNYKMIREGFAFEYTYNLPYQYQAEFQEAERLAREEGQGLWSSETCNGGTDTVNPNVPEGCDCNLTCSSIATCEDAYYQLNTCGCTGRDQDGDGIPCESTLCASNNPEPTPEPTPEPEPVPEPTTTQCKYDCISPDRNCSDFATHQEAVDFWNCCGFTATNDPMRLDGSGVDDGIPCESLP